MVLFRKRSDWRVFLFLLVAGGVGMPVSADILLLRNGDLMHGTIRGLDAGLLEFHPRWSQDPARIPLGEIRAMSFAPGDETDPPAALPSLFRMPGGEQIRGTWEATTDAEHRVSILQGHDIALSRSAVKEIIHTPAQGQALVGGPLRIEDWETLQQGGTRSAAVLHHSLYAVSGMRGWMIRTLPALPRQFWLEWEVEPLSDNFSIQFRLFARDVTTWTPGTMFIHLNRGGINLQMATQQGQQHLNTPMPPREDQSRILLRMYIDRVANTGNLWVNHEPRLSWTLVHPQHLEEANPVQFSFRVLNEASALVLHRLTLHPWDGQLPEAADLRPAPAMLFLQSSPPRQGTLLQMRGQSLQIQGPADPEPRQIPLEAVDRLTFAVRTAALPAPGEIELEFHNCDSLMRGQLLALNPETLQVRTAWSEAPLTLPRSRISRLHLRSPPPPAASEGISLDLNQPILFHLPGRP